MGCSQNLANGHLMVSRGYLVHENLVPKFPSPYPSDVLCPLHAQSGVCRARWVRVCMYSAWARVVAPHIILVLACSFQLHGKKLRCWYMFCFINYTLKWYLTFSVTIISRAQTKQMISGKFLLFKNIFQVLTWGHLTIRTNHSIAISHVGQRNHMAHSCCPLSF